MLSAPDEAPTLTPAVDSLALALVRLRRSIEAVAVDGPAGAVASVVVFAIGATLLQVSRVTFLHLSLATADLLLWEHSEEAGHAEPLAGQRRVRGRPVA